MNLADWVKEHFPTARYFPIHAASTKFLLDEILVEMWTSNSNYFARIFVRDSEVTSWEKAETPEKAIEKAINYHATYCEKAEKQAADAKERLELIKSTIKLGEGNEV